MGNKFESNEGDEARPEEKPKIRIQSFASKWQESTEECIKEVIRTQRNDPNAEVKPRYNDIQKNCQRFPNEDFKIAVDEETDEVVGTIGIRFLKEGIGQLIRFSVRPAFEGKGIGSQLYDELMSYAKANSYREIYLTTGASLTHAKARGMYEKRGFKRLSFDDLSEDTKDLILSGDDNIKHIEEGKTLIYKLELEKEK